MESVKVKECMIPIEDYVSVGKNDSLFDVLRALEEKRGSAGEHAHRDAIVVDENGEFVGKVTMIDIFRSLEPNYKKMEQSRKNVTLTANFVLKAAREFNLWMEPEETLCERGRRLKVADVMHSPGRTERLSEDDTLEAALHLFVMGVHQPLIVKKGEKVTGVLRFGDLFEVVRKTLLSCDAGLSLGKE
jgi:CBS domain-containing protein